MIARCRLTARVNSVVSMTVAVCTIVRLMSFRQNLAAVVVCRYACHPARIRVPMYANSRPDRLIRHANRHAPQVQQRLLFRKMSVELLQMVYRGHCPTNRIPSADLLHLSIHLHHN